MEYFLLLFSYLAIIDIQKHSCYLCIYLVSSIIAKFPY